MPKLSGNIRQRSIWLNLSEKNLAMIENHTKSPCYPFLRERGALTENYTERVREGKREGKRERE